MYEKAVSVDPTNAAAWEAIQRMASDAGDITRVIECLEQRKKHTDIPRQRAVVLVELARVQQQHGDEEAAKKSYEAAIRADSSNEAAAVYMLDAYTADERWAEAAPLCELLVNAAVRDRDQDALFIRLRLQTRIAAALGDAERALTASMAALDTQPQDAGAQSDLLAVASQCSGSASLMRAKDHLLRVSETVEDLTNEQVIKLAVLLRELKDLDASGRCFEVARRREPENHGLTKQLSEIYLEQGDFPRACKLKVDIARTSPNGDTRFDLFMEAGEIWAKRADELEKAASVFEEARQIKPLDRKLLETLKWLYTELGEWELVVGVMEDLIQFEDKADKKLEIVLQIGETVRDKLGDSVRAVDAADRALDLDRKRLDIFEGIVRTLTEEKDWERLERAYRKMIARVKDDDDAQLMFLLFHQLGLIYRDRIGDASRAFDALDAASNLDPSNVEVRKIVIELLIVTDQLDNAVARVREEIDRDPHQADLYAELYELFLRQHYFDKAWCCVNVLSRLMVPNADQRRFHEDYAPMPLDRVPGQIVEQAWKSHIFHVDLDPALTNILAILTPAVARMRFGQLRPEQRVGRPFTPNHSRMHQQIREAFDNSSEILAVASPELLVADLNSIHPFAPALAPFGGVLVCGPAIEAQSVSLHYLVGKKLAEQRPELSARAFFPAEKELATLLASSMRVARNEGTKEPTGSALDAALASSLSPQETAQLRNAMMQALADNTAFDVKRWLQVADLSSMRAGLLIAGDIEPARQAIGCEVTAASDLTPRDKLGELLKFAVSDLYTDLRGAIGVAVQS
jgi:tetratricopeptide (TPR) repeat protein